uniref:Uncharacterized protein n=1 Tax=Oryza brachyantha TaxID=4533 RepID=J3LWU2_ORYBR
MPILVKRKSDRQRGHAIPIHKRAKNLVKRKNLEESGSTDQEISNHIATIKAKELAQAKLEEVEWKKKNEK